MSETDATTSSGNNDREQTLRQVTHDLRHCLHTLYTGIEILRKAGGDESRRLDVLALMEKDQQQAARLLEELLSFVRDEAAEAT